MEEEIKRGVLTVIHWIVVVFIVQILVFGIGRVTLFAFSGGRFGKDDWMAAHQNWTYFTGFAVIALMWTLIALCNNGLLW